MIGYPEREGERERGEEGEMLCRALLWKMK